MDRFPPPPTYQYSPIELSSMFVHVQDITDLFGADLPVEGGEGGQFAWRDGPLLQALKAGHWVVLDEVSVKQFSATQHTIFFFYNFDCKRI